MSFDPGFSISSQGGKVQVSTFVRRRTPTTVRSILEQSIAEGDFQARMDRIEIVSVKYIDQSTGDPSNPTLDTELQEDANIRIRIN